ncbi:unnamed protein product [Symbiodinium necroappetens]|uniref:Uncharacterized protein n=1 Tax=Symbiodinium necroappetens TaxID=1628268 RepID=A0A812LUM5_9DINO|nr:unnamed protein product [Symbiodinium necroappetens]
MAMPSACVECIALTWLWHLLTRPSEPIKDQRPSSLQATSAGSISSRDRQVDHPRPEPSQPVREQRPGSVSERQRKIDHSRSHGPIQGFRVQRPDDMKALSATSFVLNGTTVRNNKAPFEYGFVLGSTRSHRMYHAGLLFKSEFEVGTVKYRFAFADRVHDGIEIYFSNNEESVDEMFKRFRCIHDGQADPFTDCVVKSWHQSWTPAAKLHDFICTELARKFEIFGFKCREDLANKQKLTNCIAFTCRGGAVMARDGECFLADSSALVAQICDRRL